MCAKRGTLSMNWPLVAAVVVLAGMPSSVRASESAVPVRPRASMSTPAEVVDWMTFLATRRHATGEGCDFGRLKLAVILADRLRAAQDPALEDARDALRAYLHGDEVQAALATSVLGRPEDLEPFAVSTDSCVRFVAVRGFAEFIVPLLQKEGVAASLAEDSGVRAAAALANGGAERRTKVGPIRVWRTYAWAWVEMEGSGCQTEQLFHREPSGWRQLGLLGAIACDAPFPEPLGAPANHR
jgi:hypothetical protein